MASEWAWAARQDAEARLPPAPLQQVLCSRLGLALPAQEESPRAQRALKPVPEAQVYLPPRAY